MIIIYMLLASVDLSNERRGVMTLLVVLRPLWGYGRGPVCDIARLPTLKVSGANLITGGHLNGATGTGIAANFHGLGISISRGESLTSMEQRGGLDGGGGTGLHRMISGSVGGHT